MHLSLLNDETVWLVSSLGTSYAPLIVKTMGKKNTWRLPRKITARFKQETSRKTVLVKKAGSEEGCTVEVCPPCNTWAPLRRAKHLQAAVLTAQCTSVSAAQSTRMKVNKPSYPSNALRKHCKATHHHVPCFDEQISPKHLAALLKASELTGQRCIQLLYNFNIDDESRGAQELSCFSQE